MTSATHPVATIVGSLKKFLRLESTSALLLLAASALALAWANSPWREGYFRLLELPIGIRMGGFSLAGSPHDLVNDGLMTFFFLLVGLEIKRELVAGELAGIKQAALPVAAALGGMLVPALIYLAFNHGQESAKGWGIPMATDIAFAVGVLALLGERVPNPLKIFLMALAIIDDLGSILVIAAFYSEGVSWAGLGYAAAAFGALMALNRLGVRQPFWYGGFGILLWHLLRQAGIHGTMAGVLTAWTIPAALSTEGKSFASLCRGILARFEAFGDVKTGTLNHERLDCVGELERACEGVQPPLQRLIKRIHPWTAFVILPLFALANSGVRIDLDLVGEIWNRAGLGIFLGLTLGKPLGIFAACRAAVSLGLPLPGGGVKLNHLLGVGMLGGIGFTMSMFVSGLAFGNSAQGEAAKISIFLASAVSGALGWIYLRMLLAAPKGESGKSG